MTKAASRKRTKKVEKVEVPPQNPHIRIPPIQVSLDVERVDGADGFSKFSRQYYDDVVELAFNDRYSLVERLRALANLYAGFETTSKISGSILVGVRRT